MKHTNTLCGKDADIQCVEGGGIVTTGLVSIKNFTTIYGGMEHNVSDNPYPR
jgi:hypothetical protein